MSTQARYPYYVLSYGVRKKSAVLNYIYPSSLYDLTLGVRIVWREREREFEWEGRFWKILFVKCLSRKLKTTWGGEYIWEIFFFFFWKNRRAWEKSIMLNHFCPSFLHDFTVNGKIVLKEKVWMQGELRENISGWGGFLRKL